MNSIIRTILIIISTLILVIGISSYYLYQHFNNELLPVEGQKIIQVNIPKGSTIKKAASILADHELIRNAEYFTYYIRWKYKDSQFIAGDYQLQQGSSVDDIILTLSSGDVLRDTVRFTIPEGYTVEQIAMKLADEGLVDEQKFLAAANSTEYDYWFINEIPENQQVKYILEGFLFPETYEVNKSSTETQIIDRMLMQFEQEYIPEWRILSEQSDVSIYDIVTMASIVEREAVVDKERPIIAGVFYNRLLSKPAWRLESCATVQYALGKQRDIITFADLEVDSPFNTYIYEGLPPAPIASPGRESLKAAVIPEQHNYYFFVTKKDGTSEHHFSTTLQEHQRNDAKSRGSW